MNKSMNQSVMIEAKKWFFLTAALGLGGMASAAESFAASIMSIDFKDSADASLITIRGDGPLAAEKTENSAEKQIVLDFRDATLAKGAARRIDTSSFNSPVLLVSPYPVDGNANAYRLVVQLKSNAAGEMSQNGNLILLRIPKTAGVANAQASKIDETPAAANNPPASDFAAAPVDPMAAPQAAVSSNPDGLGSALETRETKRFSGKPISLQVRDADVTDVLRLISDASGFNIVVGDDVKGKLTLSLSEVPWDQALDVVLRTLKLGAERNNNVLRVVTLSQLTLEKQQELTAKIAAQETAPTVVKFFPISYADPIELADTLRAFLNRPAGASGLGNSSGAVNVGPKVENSQIQVDKRTSSIVVQDVQENIDKVTQLIKILDTQTPQVFIEAKVVEASEGFTKQFGGSLGMGSSGSTNYFASFAGGNPLDSLIGTATSTGVFANGAAIGATSRGGGAFGLAPTLSFLPGLPKLNALLSMAESENAIKVVSSPKIVTLNKQTASVVQSTPVGVPVTTVSNGVSINTVNIMQANLSLKVTPTVTGDGSVQLDLNLERGIPFSLATGGQAVADRSMKTKVLVESGSTLVIGGVYTMENTRTSSGFPILRKIPILGALFGSESENTSRSELFFFITPKILNVKEAGLGT